MDRSGNKTNLGSTAETFPDVVFSQMQGLLSSFEGGFHDLAILKPYQKHVCTVPKECRVSAVYRVGCEGKIYPAEMLGHRISDEPVFSTDPAFAMATKDRLNIFDGNQRMVFVLETDIEGVKMKFVMIAHAATLVSGIQSMVQVGDHINPKEILFKFYQGSSLSTLWPKEFFTFSFGKGGRSKYYR